MDGLSNEVSVDIGRGLTPWVARSSDMPEHFCHACGYRFDETELLRFDPVRVCAACKPEFVQRLREGEAVGAPRVCSDPWYVRVW